MNKLTMQAIVGVRFAPAGRVHYFNSAGLDLAIGDRVMVEAGEGPREARVAISPGQIVYSDLRGPVGTVLRIVVAC